MVVCIAKALRDSICWIFYMCQHGIILAPEPHKLRKWLYLCPGWWLESHTELTACSETIRDLWFCSRWWSDQSSRSHPELSVAYSPHPVHCNSSDGKLHYFQGKDRASQPDFIKSHTGDCLLFSKSKQKDLLSFWPLFSPSYNAIMPTLMIFSHLRGQPLYSSENQKLFGLTTSRPNKRTKQGPKTSLSSLPHFYVLILITPR